MTAAAKKPLLERVGVAYFEKRSARHPLPSTGTPADAVHQLNPAERVAVDRVQRGAIFRSCLAGAISAVVAAVAEVWATPVPEGAAFLSRESLNYWGIVAGAAAIAAVLEILFLYWDILRSVHEMSRVTGVELFGKDKKDANRQIAAALARAALELPNPIDVDRRINPRRESSKLRLLAASVVYKAKVGVSNFLMKMLVRRILGRVFVRSLLVTSAIPFVAVPITAAWNGVVTWLVLREARLRAMGPSAAHELVRVVFADAPALTDAGRLAAVRAVAAAIVRTQDLHPNLVAVLIEVQRKAGDTGTAELDDPGEFLRSLKTLSPGEQRLALQTLVVACVVDGRVTRREKKLTQAFAELGRPVDFGPVHRLQREFIAGNGVADDAMRAI